jgi:hypothetical protein
VTQAAYARAADTEAYAVGHHPLRYAFFKCFPLLLSIMNSYADKRLLIVLISYVCLRRQLHRKMHCVGYNSTSITATT